jgi:HEAT repeat protein
MATVTKKKKIMNHLRGKILVEVLVMALLSLMFTATAAPSPNWADPRDITRTLKFLRNPEYAATTPAILPFLHHEDAHVVRDTCRTLAVIGTKDVIPDIQPLLNDKRSDVRKDAQDAINKLSANPRPEYRESSPTLASFDPKDTIRTLKLLRSPEFAATVPAILPLLHNDSANVVRDACRTLAVIATKEYIPSIEPLLDDKRDNVRKDAQDAIDKLRAKS